MGVCPGGVYTTCRQNDRRLWKHYLSATNVEGDKNNISTYEPVRKKLTSNNIHGMTSMWIDVIGAFWRAAKREWKLQHRMDTNVFVPCTHCILISCMNHSPTEEGSRTSYILQCYFRTGVSQCQSKDILSPFNAFFFKQTSHIHTVWQKIQTFPVNNSKSVSVCSEKTVAGGGEVGSLNPLTSLLFLLLNSMNLFS